MQAPHWTSSDALLREVLKAQRLGVATDFDGTVSHYTTDPKASVILPANARALEALAERIAVVGLVSGRPARDLHKLFEHPKLIYYGSHGMDYWHVDEPAAGAEASDGEAHIN